MMRKLLVLAGGFGTRLRPLVSNVPKTLAPVGNFSFLQLLVAHWIKQGANDFVFLLHHEAEQIIEMIKNQYVGEAYNNISFDWIIEDEPLGTGGSVANAVDKLSIRESFYVTNSDTWLGEVLPIMNSSIPGSCGVVRVKNTGRYGRLMLKDGLIIEFEEKGNSSESGWINAGLYHLAPVHLSKSRKERTFSLERDVFPDLAKNKKMHAIKLETDFIDIGVPADYLKFCAWIETGGVSEI